MDIQILILLLILQNRQNTKNTTLHSLNNYIQNIEVDLAYTGQKIDLVKKIAPLMPPEYVNPLNRSLLITESVIKLLELQQYMDESQYMINQNELIFIEDNKDRIKKIITLVQEEAPKSNMANMGMVLDLIVNMDQYKKMFTTFTTFMNNQDAMKDPQNIIKLMQPFMSDKNDKNNKDMEQMINIINLLSSPNKKPKKENTP